MRQLRALVVSRSRSAIEAHDAFWLVKVAFNKEVTKQACFSYKRLRRQWSNRKSGVVKEMR